MPVKPIPDGYHSVTPYLIVGDASAAIEFYKTAFGAIELVRMAKPGGKIGHAEILIGDAPVMLADENPMFHVYAPKPPERPPLGLVLYVEDVDAVFHKAVAAGATVLLSVQDQFYGDRSGTLTDPFGHVWTVATHKEDVPPEEMKRRTEEAMKARG
jgi:PhnB protein